MGMHNSRKLQLEQATLMAWGFMVYLMVQKWICLGSSLELKPKKQPFSRDTRSLIKITIYK
jgi:hypothetical protein